MKRKRVARRRLNWGVVADTFRGPIVIGLMAAVFVGVIQACSSNARQGVFAGLVALTLVFGWGFAMSAWDNRYEFFDYDDVGEGGSDE